MHSLNPTRDAWKCSLVARVKCLFVLWSFLKRDLQPVLPLLAAVIFETGMTTWTKSEC